MTATLNRKNNGKQFTVVDTATRNILHWHRPGDHLPILIEGDLFDRDTYVVTQDDVDTAKINKRVHLKAAEVNWEHMKQHSKWTTNPDGSESTSHTVYHGLEDHVLKDAYINGKGQPIVELVKAKTFGAADWALCSVVGAAALAVGYELVKVFA